MYWNARSLNLERFTTGSEPEPRNLAFVLMDLQLPLQLIWLQMQRSSIIGYDTFEQIQNPISFRFIIATSKHDHLLVE